MTGFIIRNLIFTQVFLFSISIIYVSSASSATIYLEPSPNCEIRLSGKISTGDFRSLEQAVNKIDQKTLDKFDRPFRLCLDSPGGSLGEASKIARYVYEWGIATRVEANAECLSACAWIFMMGTSDQGWGKFEGEYQYIDRSMDATAKLGFHAPFLELGSNEYVPRILAEQGFEILISAFAEILSLSFNINDDRPIILSDLIEEAMRTSSEEMYYLDTVDKAGRWNINITGLSFPNPLGQTAAVNVCLNTSRWHVALASNISNLETSKNLIYGEGRSYPEYFYKNTSGLSSIKYETSEQYFDISYGGYHSEFCRIKSHMEKWSNHMENAYANNPHILGCLDFSAYTMNTCSQGLRWISPIAVFPPNARLDELAKRSVDLARALSLELNDFARPDWCPNASTEVERAICGNQELSALEIKLDQVYQRVRGTPEARSIARIGMTSRNTCGTNIKCLAERISETIVKLEAF